LWAEVKLGAFGSLKMLVSKFALGMLLSPIKSRPFQGDESALSLVAAENEREGASGLPINVAEFVFGIDKFGSNIWGIVRELS
jgi:hypothetical protein